MGGGVTALSGLGRLRGSGSTLIIFMGEGDLVGGDHHTDVGVHPLGGVCSGEVSGDKAPGVLSGLEDRMRGSEGMTDW